MKFDQDNKKGFIKSLITLGISIVLLLLNIPGFLNFIRGPLSFVYEPITFGGSRIGVEISDTLKIFSEIGELRSEVNRLEVDNTTLKSKVDYISVISQENEALRDELELGSKEDVKVLAKVVKGMESDVLHLNIGSSDNVSKGDIVYYGNIYIGSVVSVGEYGSTVSLPQARTSHLQVMVVLDHDISMVGVDDIESELSAIVKLDGIAVGMSNLIQIENVLTDSGVEVGDIVIVNDKEVGEYLLLGTVGSIDFDPAATTSLINLVPYINYNELETVFVSVKGGIDD